MRLCKLNLFLPYTSLCYDFMPRHKKIYLCFLLSHATYHLNKQLTKKTYHLKIRRSVGEQMSKPVSLPLFSAFGTCKDMPIVEYFFTRILNSRLKYSNKHFND